MNSIFLTSDGLIDILIDINDISFVGKDAATNQYKLVTKTGCIINVDKNFYDIFYKYNFDKNNIINPN